MVDISTPLAIVIKNFFPHEWVCIHYLSRNDCFCEYFLILKQSISFPSLRNRNLLFGVRRYRSVSDSWLFWLFFFNFYLRHIKFYNNFSNHSEGLIWMKTFNLNLCVKWVKMGLKKQIMNYAALAERMQSWRNGVDEEVVLTSEPRR